MYLTLMFISSTTRHMLAYVVADLIYRQVVGVGTERIFNFLRNQLQAGQGIKYQDNHRYDKISQAEHPAEGECHDIEEHEFLMKTL